MKKILIALLTLVLAVMTLNSCKEPDPIYYPDNTGNTTSTTSIETTTSESTEETTEDIGAPIVTPIIPF